MSNRSHKHYLRHNIREALKKAELSQSQGLYIRRDMWLDNVKILIKDYCQGLSKQDFDQFALAAGKRWAALGLL